ncbi:MAG: binding-protein-dependent transport system inner rane component [Anaerocolumna sp.]|nr:binding-protein-dependent transport system inner rane component [Anaerocolumna sp.]
MKNRFKFLNRTLPLITLVSPVAVWLFLLVAAPMLYIFFLSFLSTDGYKTIFKFTLDNYKNLVNPTYLEIYANSFLVAFFTTVICIIVGYPFAYQMAKANRKRKTVMMVLLMLPFWTNSLIRLNAWKTLLGKTGIINNILIDFGFIGEPIEFLYTRGAVLLGMVYVLIPYMILPLFASLDKLEPSLLEASGDLGAGKIKTFLNITLPLTFAGIFSGSIMIFIPSLGYFFVSDIMGGGKSQLIGNLIETQFKAANNWPFGASLSMMLIFLILFMVTAYKKTGGDVKDLGVM